MYARIAAMAAAVALTSLTASAAPDVVATVDGQPITRAELEKSVKPQLIEVESQRYEILRDGLDEMIAQQLLEKEAKARSITVEQLNEQEVSSKVPAPSDEEIQKVYDANKQQLGGATLEQVKDRIVQYLKSQEEAKVQAAFLDTLRKKYHVNVALQAPKIEVAAGDSPATGPANAPITIIEFSDYECPFCKKAEGTVQQVLSTYPEQVRLIYRNYPLPFHKDARPAAEAAMCAKAQNKFWEYHEKLFKAAALDTESLKKMAGEVGLDQAKFDECLEKKPYSADIDKDIADASAVGVRGTPAFFINGRMLSGAQPFDKFQEIIVEELAAAKS